MVALLAATLAIASAGVAAGEQAAVGTAGVGDGATLDGTSLDDTALDGTSLDGAALDDTALDGDSLDGASLAGAQAAENGSTTGPDAAEPEGVRSGYYEGVDEPTENVVTDWTVETDARVDVAPVVEDGVAYLSSRDGYVYAIDVEDGSTRWRYHADAQVRGQVEVTEDAVYVADWSGEVVRLDRQSASVEWRFETHQNVDAAPTRHDGSLLVATRAGTVYSLDAASGVKEWERGIGSGEQMSSPVVVDDAAYVTVVRRQNRRDGVHLYALSTDDGSTEWSFRYGQTGYRGSYGGDVSEPALRGDELYVRDPIDDELEVRNRTDRSVRWRRGTDGDPSTVAVADEHVYVGDGGGRVYMLDRANGDRLQDVRTAGGIASVQYVDGEVLATSADWRLYGLDARGVIERWRYETTGPLRTPPVIVDGRLLTVREDTLLALGDRDAPTAAFDQTPENPVTGEAVAFDADRSYDRGGSIDGYAWDLDDDGTPEVSGADARRVTHAFSTPGTHTVSLTVTDETGTEATTRHSFVVSDAEGPNSAGVDYSNTGHSPDARGLDENVVRDWTASIPGSPDGHPTANADTLFVPDGDRYVYGIDRETGNVTWRFEAGAVRGSPTYLDGTVYVASTSGTVYSLHASNGTEQWRYDVGTRIETAPVPHDGSVYVAAAGGRVYRIDGQAGRTVWGHSFGSGDQVGAPTFVDGTLYVTTIRRNNRRDGLHLAALDARSGNVRWQQRLGQTGYRGSYGGPVPSPVYADGRLYVADPVEDQLQVHAAEDGRQFWTTGHPSGLRAAPAVTDDVIAVADGNGQVRTYERRTFDLVKRVQVDGAVHSSPVVAGDRLYVATRRDRVHSFAAPDLSDRWRHETNGPVSASPVVGGGHVVALTDWGSLHRLDDTDAPTARFSYDPAVPRAGQQVTLDASASVDRQGSVASYRWDVHADGAVDERGETVDVRFHQPGDRTVRLTVVDDDDGAASTVEKTVTVVGRGTWPTAHQGYARTGHDPRSSGVVGPVNETWSADVGTRVDRTATLDAHRLYVVSRDGNLSALDRTTGNLSWRFRSESGLVGSPTVHEGTVYLATRGGEVYALDAATGERQWRYRTGATMQTSPVAQDGSVYLTDHGGTVYRVDEGGYLEWQQTFGSGDQVSGPTLVDGALYVSTIRRNNRRDGLHLARIDARNGRVEWSQRLGQTGYRGSYGGAVPEPVYRDGRLYVSDPVDDQVHVRSPADGHGYWTADQPGHVADAPAVTDDAVYVGAHDGWIYSFDRATGELVHRTEVGEEFDASPVVVGDAVYATTRDGGLHAFTTGDVQHRWSHQFAGEVSATPVATSRSLYVTTRRGTVHALGAQRGDLSARRTVETPVEPGETATVTVTVTAETELVGPAIEEHVPGALDVRNRTARSTTGSEAHHRSGADQWLWLTADAGDELVLEYEVAVPADAPRGGEYEFDGQVSSAEYGPAAIGGDDRLRLAACANRVVAGPDGRLSLVEIQRALTWWAEDEPVPGTGGTTLSLEHAQALVNHWTNDRPISCGSP